MMKKKKNVSTTVHDGLCMGCGICLDVCSKGCIKIKHDLDSNYPIVDNDKCTECGLCLKVCAGKGIDIGEKSKQIFCKGSIQQNAILGYFHKCFTGYSKNRSIRYHSSSGGTLSTFLIYLLRHRIIDGAAVTGWSQDDCMKPQPFIARSPKDVICSRGSKYCVVSMEGIAKTIVDIPGKYVVVGLPCHIQAYRKFSEINKKFRESVIGYFAIYCSSNRTMRSQKYLLDKYGVDKKEVKFFSYRDEGCLGNMNFRTSGMVPLKRVAYENFWQGMRGFFNVPRCSTCIDHYGELADICFGDIFMGEHKSDHVGVNSLMSRSEEWTRLLQDAARNKWIKLERLVPNDLIKCQGYAIRQKKGNGVVAAFKIRKMLGKKNPEYDVPFIGYAGAKDCLKEVIKMCMRWMGRHEWTWPIIKKLHKDNKHSQVKGELEFVTNYDGTLIIANKEFRAFHDLHIKLETAQSEKDWYKVRKTVYSNLKAYLEFIIAYCEKELKGKEFCVDEMMQIVFDDDAKWDIEKFRRCLYAIKRFSEQLLKEISVNMAHQYDALIYTIRGDFEDVMIRYEVNIKQNVPNLRMTCKSSRSMSIKDIEWLGKNMLFVDQIQDVHSLSIRDLGPYCVFMTRQLLEIIGKRFIGYSGIVDSQGGVVKQLSQVSWTFLSEKENELKDIIQLPLSVKDIQKLNSWANHFTHSAIIEPIYLQFYAWCIVAELNKLSKEGRVKDERRLVSFMHGNFRIKDYAFLKSEFEKFVEEKKPGAVVKWLPVEEVQAYIEG